MRRLLLLATLVAPLIAPGAAAADPSHVHAATTDEPQTISCHFHTQGAQSPATATTLYSFYVGLPGSNCHPPNGIKVTSTVRLVDALGLPIVGTERTLVTETEPDYPGNVAGHQNYQETPILPQADRVEADVRARLRLGIRWRPLNDDAKLVCDREDDHRTLACDLSAALSP